MEDEVGSFRDRFFPPITTLSAFISQTLSEDHSCLEAVTRIRSDLVAQGKNPCSPGTGGYCQARNRLPEDLILRVLRETGQNLHNQTEESWLWKGRRVVLVDGSTVSMPDTPENQAAYPQPKSQKPGLGFPLARLAVLISFASGGLLDFALGPCKGKKTGEHALFRQMFGNLHTGDVLIADRYYCSYFLIAALINAGLDAVFEIHASRKSDFRRGVRLGIKDHIVTWTKPVRPDWMDQETYDAMPATVSVRETKAEGKTLISTFMDPKTVTRKDLAKLYRIRWSVEIDLKFIKQVLHMDVLRCKKPEMVRKEIGVHLLAYNLIRTVMAQAASIYGILPNTISFKGTVQALNSFRKDILSATNDRLSKLFDELLRGIAYHRIGNRPGRLEPRVVKRRPKPYPRMTQPRTSASLSL